MGKSKSKTTQQQTQSFNNTQTAAPSNTYSPFINDAAGTLRPAYDASQAQLGRVMPGINAGLDYYNDVLSGDYMNANPYLDDVIGDTNRSIMDSVTGEFSGAGRYGSGYHNRTIADRLAANENAIRGAEYGRERAFMDAAPRNIAALGSASVALPQVPSSAYAEAIAQLLGRYGTTTGSGTGTSSGTSTTVQSPSTLGVLGSILGTGLSAWAGGGLGGFGGFGGK